jgi:hypothetical protein
VSINPDPVCGQYLWHPKDEEKDRQAFCILVKNSAPNMTTVMFIKDILLFAATSLISDPVCVA